MLSRRSESLEMVSVLLLEDVDLFKMLELIFGVLLF
jgi:hypothetical protein